MKILLVGGGAREHVIGEYVKKNNYKLYSFLPAKNPGIAKISTEYKIGNILSPEEVLDYALRKEVDAVIIGPEAPLAAGVVDKILDFGISCIGPEKEIAKIETDKIFARKLMTEHDIKGYPEFGVFSKKNKEELNKFIEKKINVAVKPVGLTGGKGVKVTGKQLNDVQEAKFYAAEILDKEGIVLIEEKIEGEEFTIQGFCDGKRVIGSPAVQDHKAAYENDLGPNTGGMGSYTSNKNILPFMTEKDYEEGLEIMNTVLRALKNDTEKEYVGFLYGQFIAAKEGVKVVEFNARLGDPEAINILPILKDNFIEKMIDNNLTSLNFENFATVCKYLVPNGYPENPVLTTVKVQEDKIIEKKGSVYYASVKEENGEIKTSKSRAVALLGISEEIADAENISEECCKYVSGDLYHRRDIGTYELINKRIEHMKKLRT